MCVSLPACNGLFEDVYDEPPMEEPKDFGFIETDDATHSGTVYVDATDYTKWIYIDLHAQTVDSTRIIGEDGTELPLQPSTALPEEWDFAIHRYDTKTNGGAVLETGATGIESVVAGGTIPAGNYVADVETTDKITIDMSHMMEGEIVYARSDYNTELSKWLNVNTSTMPPAYTPSNKVYILKLKDGTHAALRLADFKNASSVKGFMKVEYVYPLEEAIK